MQVGATERNGLKLGDMTPAQEKAALALVAAVLSRDGFQKVMAIVDADQVLEEQSAPTRAADARDPLRTRRVLRRDSRQAVGDRSLDDPVRRPSPRHQRDARRRGRTC